MQDNLQRETPVKKGDQGCHDIDGRFGILFLGLAAILRTDVDRSLLHPVPAGISRPSAPGRFREVDALL